MIETPEQQAAMTALAIKAAEKLQGSSGTLVQLGEEYEEAENNSFTFCAVLDDLVFKCTVCNNWFEQSEMSEEHDWICNSCGITMDQE